MTDDDLPVDGDPVVRTALQLLPVPPHGDAFWSDLGRVLDDATGGVDRSRAVPLRAPDATAAADGATPAAPLPVAELAPDPGLGLVPPALRRRSNVAAAVAAVAAAVLVVVAGATLVRQRSGTEVDTAGVIGSVPESTVLASTTTSAAPGASGDDAERSSAAVLAWVAALGESDAEAAWSAMGNDARRHLGTRAAFDEMMTGLAEGFGAWSAATPEHVLVTPLTTSGDGSLLVVTLVGEVHQEGVAQHRADAFVVRLAGDAIEVEPFDVAGEVEVVVPDETAGTTAVVDGDELVVVVPEGAEAPVLRLDDGPSVVCGEDAGTELTTLDEAPGRRCAYSPEGGIEPGQRVLTVAFTATGSTAISAESVLFQAA